MQNPGKGRSRLLVFVVLAFAAVLAPAGAAQADNASVAVRVDAFGTPGQVVEVTPTFNLDFAGTRHLAPGGSFQTSLAPNGSPYVASDSQTWTVPSTWGTTTSRFTFRPKLRVTLPSDLGRSDHFVSLNVATDTCPAGLGPCITGSPVTVQVRTEVKPRPVSNEKVTGDNTGIEFTWTHTPDVAQIDRYHIERSDMATRVTDVIDPYDRTKTSYRETATVPGHQYCYRIIAIWEDTSGSFNTSDGKVACGYMNRAPGAPGAPAANPGLTNGPTTVSWAPADDPDGNIVTYTLQHKDDDDGDNWTTIWQGFPATSLPVVEQGGTWRYRVRATDHHGTAGEWSEIGPEHKADTTGPGVPKVSYDKTPAPGNWFKDSVTLTFSDAIDSLLPDGSLGGGVGPEGYPAPITLSTHGEHRVAEQARDRVGNGGAIVPTYVNVDTKAPQVSVSGCPTKRVLEGTDVRLAYTASDAGSGLAQPSPASGDVALDTSTPGEHVRTITARDNVGHATESDPCKYTVYRNSAPPTPAAPSVPADRRDGTFEVNWGAVTDADPEDSVEYVVQQRDADDADWSDVPGRFSAAKLGADGAEGTWTFRVKAIDSHNTESAWSGPSPEVKVDHGAPSAPTATPDRAPEFGDWFKDKVTVSFADSTDPDLADTSDGTGVAAYTAPKELRASGSASGTATDAVGNVSGRTSLDVKVDALAPTATTESCPSNLIVGQPASMDWSARDGESGIRGAASGTLALDTSSPGTRTATGPAPVDNVGHTGDAPKCTYSVAYKFAGFLSPINGTAVNVGKTGRTYPIKWRLQRYDGSLISDSEAQALVPAMVAGDRKTDCSSFSLLPEDALEEAATGGTELRYDAAADQFIYNYKAPDTTGCYVLAIRNADGASTKQVNFTFTR